VAAVSRALKSMAREINVPVVVLAQLNRMAEAREDHRPRLADLRESGAIENDADVALLLFRPEYYAKTDAERASLHGRAEIHVAKQRSGPVGLVPAYFRAPLVRFENAARGQLEVVR
jgi:replicative DNA helicase